MSRKKKCLIDKRKIRLAAQFMAASNFGRVGSYSNERELRAFIRKFESDFSAAGVDIESEIKSWERELNRGDKFTCKTVKKELPWLFED